VPQSAIAPPLTDPTSIIEHYRGSYGSDLLTAAAQHFKLFDRLAAGPLSFAELQQRLRLAERPTVVLVCALRAMRLLEAATDGRLGLTPIAREHLVSTSYFDISDYLGLSASSPSVQAMIERLTTNAPAGQKPEEEGAAFIYREGIDSAMEQEATARRFTLALCGRAKNVAPFLAERVSLSDCRLLVDVGGGTGIYSIACLQKNPNLRAIVWDRPEVLKVAHEMATSYGVLDRLELRPGDMFVDSVPTGADALLVSNILHDWAEPECRRLLQRFAAALEPGGRLLLHDVFLDDDLGGPLPIALYSAALFSVTEGRAYSAAEYRRWLSEAGLTPGAITPTLVHCGVLSAIKSV
jgi:predicted O-methyltransferase YrrM